MKHKAPCSSRGYSGLRESGPLNIDGGRWWRCWWRWRRCWCRSPSHDDGPGGVPAPPGERGREPPSFFFFLDLLPRWEEGFPSGPWLPWRRRGRSPSEIGSPSLFSSVSRSQILALHRFLNIRRSVTPIAPILSPDFSPGNYLSCARRRARTALRGGQHPPGRVTPLGAPLWVVGTLGLRLPWFRSPKITYIPKKISVKFYSVWTPFDMDFLRIKNRTENRNWHWALD